MQVQELRLNYQEAIHLVRVGRYEEAVRILEDIDAERPDIKNVLYPMAVCYERLGRTEDAFDTCEKLIAQYDHEKARIIKARLELHGTYPEAVEVAEFESEEEKSIQEIPSEGGEGEPPDADNDNDNDAVAQAEENQQHHRKPTWLVLLIALVAAALVAGVLHLFVLTP